MFPNEPAWVTRLRHALFRLERLVGGSALLLLLALVFGQVLARNLFDSGIPYVDVLLRHLVLYVTFLGAAMAIDSQRHIKLDLVAVCLSPAALRLLKPPLYLVSAALCSVMSWASMRFWYDDWQYIADHERWSSALGIITPAGFLLLALHFLICGLFRTADSGSST